MNELTVKSPAFDNEQKIPKKYSCDGQEVNPPLSIEGIPKEAKTLALIIEDPDATSGTFNHWIVWNIPPNSKIEENSIPGNVGISSSGQRSYVSICPPSGTHRYIFKVYALDDRLDLPESAQRKDMERAMQGHILAKGELMGLYSRNR